MSQAQNIPIADNASSEPRSALAPHGAGWVAGSELGISDRHVRREGERLKGLGAARQSGRSWYFLKCHPDVAKRLKASRIDRSFEDLSAFTHKQIKDAQDKVKIVETARREIQRRIESTGCGRTVAVEWFCKERAPQLALGKVSVRSFYGWDKKYTAAGDFKVRAFIDTRGREPGERNCSRAAWDHFKSLYLHKNKRTAMLCYEMTDEAAKEHGWTWPSYRTIVARIKRDIPPIALSRFRDKDTDFESKHVPRIRRNYEHVAACDIWCGDENTMDVFARTPDGRGGWKRVRPKLTAWLDIRSRMFIGWHIAANANSDTILAAFKMGVRNYGPPIEVICDNGTDYKAAAGRSKRRVKWDEFSQPRLNNVYSQLDCKATWAIPYKPWSKMIESHFRSVCDRFCKMYDSYCGNQPDNKPDGADKIPDWELPTVDELIADFEKWLEAHHAKPQTGSGMFNLAPEQAIVQFRSKTIRQQPDDATLDFLCSKITPKPVKVSKRGVRFENIYYGEGEDKLYALQGQEVYLRIHPERGDFVDVLDLNGRLIVRAFNDQLEGISRDDIRTANSRARKAKKIAKQYRTEAPYAARHSTASGAIDVQRKRNKSLQQDTPPPPTPDTVKLVRPDLQEDIAALEQDSTDVRRRVKRPSMVIDFEAVNRSLLGDDEPTSEEQVDDRIDDAVADRILSGGIMDFASDDELDDGDGASTIDDLGIDESEIDASHISDSEIDGFGALGKLRERRRA